MCTTVEPARGFYARLGEAERGGILSLSFAPGFPASDFPECGPTLWGTARDAAELNRTVGCAVPGPARQRAALGHNVPVPRRSRADRHPDDGGRPEARRDCRYAGQPGRRGDANTTGLLAALVRHNAKRAAIGLIHDPQAARAAHAAGPEATIHLAIGSGSGTPFEGMFVVENLSDGRCVFDGPMMHGVRLELGPSACLRIATCALRSPPDAPR